MTTLRVPTDVFKNSAKRRSMVRCMPFVVLACLLALTGEGLLWCSSRTGGAVGEPCRFAQIQASSSGVRLSDFTGCFVLFALSYNCFSAPHRHTHTGPPSDHLTTIAPNPRLLVLITASQQPGALYPSTSPPSPHLLARQASCMHTLTSTPLHVCLHPPAVREGAQSLLSNPCSSSLFSSSLSHLYLPLASVAAVPFSEGFYFGFGFGSNTPPLGLVPADGTLVPWMYP